MGDQLVDRVVTSFRDGFQHGDGVQSRGDGEFIE